MAIDYNEDMDFDPIRWQRFIQAKFVEWRGETRSSLSDFAAQCRVSPQVMSNWYLGKLKRRPSADTYVPLIDLYGIEVYEALDMPMPETNPLDQLPSDFRDRLTTAMLEIAQELNARSLDTESPEAEEISRTILSKYGFTVNSIDRTAGTF
ncbi:MAG: hypothetical protein ACYDGL_00740 [Bellilinea sp.]